MSDYYSIGKISKICNVTVKTLHFYDKIGLLKPEYRDESTNYRYYTKRQMIDVLVIRRLRALGISIDDIRSIISKPSISNYIKVISKRSDEISKSIEFLQAKKSACDVILDRMVHAGEISILENNNELFEKCTQDVRIEDVPISKILFSRKIMKNYNNADVSLDRWIDIYEKCTNNGISMQSSIITTYYTEPLSQFLLNDCDVEFAVAISGDIDAEKSNSNIRYWGGFKACTGYHVGKYSEIINSHVSMIKWIHSKNYTISGPISEIFITSPLDIQDESKHITKIIMPIKEKS